MFILPEPGGLMKECRANALPDDIPVCANTHHIHLLALHDLLELSAHLPHLAHGLAVDEVVCAPLRTVAVSFPLVVYI